MKADLKTEAGIMELFDNFQKAYASKDIEKILSFVIPEPDLALIGTGADEEMLGPEKLCSQLERDFSQAEELSIRIVPRSISALGDVAWAWTDTLIIAKSGGQVVEMPCRQTFVLMHREGRWLIAQSHLSMPLPSQAKGESFPEQKEKEFFSFD